MAGSHAETEHDAAAKEPTQDADGAPATSLARFLTPVPVARTTTPPAGVGRSTAPGSLFSEPPVLRKNASSFPTAGAAASSQSAPPESLSRPPLDLDALKLIAGGERAPTDRPVMHDTDPPVTHDVALEPIDDDLELSSIPPPLFKSAAIRMTALAAGLCVGLLGVLLLVGRQGKAPGRAARTSVAAAAATAPLPAAGVAEEEATDEEPAEPQDIAPAADAAMARELRLQARRLLEGGRAEEGVAAARRAIGADPNEPESYVLLAAGLQDLGRWQESHEVFAKCVHESDRKANAECVYFATRSK